MKRLNFRLILFVILLIISISALVWGFLPADRVIMKQKIQPTEMQIPTPEAGLPFEVAGYGFGLPDARDFCPGIRI